MSDRLVELPNSDETDELSPREKLRQDSIIYHLDLGREFGIPDDKLNDYANRAADKIVAETDKASRIDSKYNILNSVGLHEVLSKAVEASKRYGIALSAAFIDLEGLGELNAQFGQSGGDKGIRIVVEAISQTARTTDIPAVAPTPEDIQNNGGEYAAREGGDEFVVLFLGTPLEGAIAASQRIMASISQESDIKMPEYRKKLNKSFGSRAGVAQFDSNFDKDGADFLKRIDGAMYKTKHSKGRMGISSQLYKDNDYNTIVIKSFNRPK